MTETLTAIFIFCGAHPTKLSNEEYAHRVKYCKAYVEGCVGEEATLEKIEYCMEEFRQLKSGGE